MGGFRRFDCRMRLTMVVIAASMAFQAEVFAAQGWIVWAGRSPQEFVGKIFRCAVGGQTETLYEGTDAKSAYWSADGKKIYFLKSNYDIWEMSNTGANQRRIMSAANVHSIAAYSPDADYILASGPKNAGNKFYKINTTLANPTLELVQTTTKTPSNYNKGFVGIGISKDGKRIVGRDEGVFKITVGSASVDQYAGGVDKCDPGISPDGTKIMNNINGHKIIEVRSWDENLIKQCNSSVHGVHGGRWSINSNDHFSFYCEDGDANAVCQFSTNTWTKVGNSTGTNPDYWHGDLPPGGAVDVAVPYSVFMHTDTRISTREYFDVSGRKLFTDLPGSMLKGHPLMVGIVRHGENDCRTLMTIGE